MNKLLEEMTKTKTALHLEKELESNKLKKTVETLESTFLKKKLCLVFSLNTFFSLAALFWLATDNQLKNSPFLVNAVLLLFTSLVLIWAALTSNFLEFVFYRYIILGMALLQHLNYFFFIEKAYSEPVWLLAAHSYHLILFSALESHLSLMFAAKMVVFAVLAVKLAFRVEYAVPINILSIVYLIFDFLSKTHEINLCLTKNALEPKLKLNSFLEIASKMKTVFVEFDSKGSNLLNSKGKRDSMTVLHENYTPSLKEAVENCKVDSNCHLGTFTNSGVEYEIFIDKTSSSTQLFFLEASEFVSKWRNSTERGYKTILHNKLCHEFKTPCITIQSIVDEVLAESPISAEKLVKIKYFSEIILLQLMDLFDYSDTSEKKIAEEEIVVESLKEYIQRLAETSSLNLNKELKIDFFFSNSLLVSRIMTDEMRLKQILANLLSNTIKATENNDRMQIEVYHRENKNIISSRKDILVISFTNFRCEMSQTAVEFVNSAEVIEINAKNTENSCLLRSGLGIGLPICKKLCRELGFKLYCQVSDKTEVRVEIPCYNVSEKAETEEFNQSNLQIDVDISSGNYSSSRRESFREIDIDNSSFSGSSREVNVAVRHPSKKNTNLGSQKVFMDLEAVRRSSITPSFDLPSKDKTNLLKSPLLRKLTEGSNIFDTRLESTLDLKILVVDDNRSITKSESALVRSLLEEYCQFPNKIGVFELNDGVEALFQVYQDVRSNSNKIKLVICDEMMEYMNGSELCSKLVSMKASTKREKIPFVICSAFDSQEHQEIMEECEVDLVLSKPLTKTNCLKILREWVFPLENTK